jgi:hypothetical protein
MISAEHGSAKSLKLMNTDEKWIQRKQNHSDLERRQRPKDGLHLFRLRPVSNRAFFAP